jgi:Cu/Zn superoxide dismutase
VLRIVLAVLLLGCATAVATSAQTTAPQATADLRGAAGESIGAITFTQGPREVLIAINFRNRTALVGTHAAHIHASGQCDPPNFVTAGPMTLSLSDLVVGPAGVGVYNLSAPGTSVNSLAGRSLVVLQPDGTRVACGVIVAGSGDDRPDLTTSAAVGLMGALLIVGGVLLRRRPQAG